MLNSLYRVQNPGVWGQIVVHQICTNTTGAIGLDSGSGTPTQNHPYAEYM